jgi:hypothetical protein
MGRVMFCLLLSQNEPLYSSQTQPLSRSMRDILFLLSGQTKLLAAFAYSFAKTAIQALSRFKLSRREKSLLFREGGPLRL